MATVPCQRWRRRRSAWRPAGELFDPGRHAVELIPDDVTARRFITEHHYSGSYPAARLRVGLYRAGVGLVGVAVYSVPMSQAAVPRYTGLPPAAGVELGRFVLLDEVEGNGESWFLARAARLLRQQLPEVGAVLSYSDPVPRRTAEGDVVLPGHVGTIYQATNGTYLGRSKPRYLHLGPDGQVVSERALSKLRRGDRGAAYAYEQLRAKGAPARRPGEEGPAYVTRALAEGPFRRVRHPGNHVYAWAWARGHELGASRPYPKQVEQEAAA